MPVFRCPECEKSFGDGRSKDGRERAAKHVIAVDHGPDDYMHALDYVEKDPPDDGGENTTPEPGPEPTEGDDDGDGETTRDAADTNPIYNSPTMSDDKKPTTCPECDEPMNEAQAGHLLKGEVDGETVKARTDGGEHWCSDCKILKDGDTTMTEVGYA